MPFLNARIDFGLAPSGGPREGSAGRVAHGPHECIKRIDLASIDSVNGFVDPFVTAFVNTLMIALHSNPFVNRSLYASLKYIVGCICESISESNPNPVSESIANTIAQSVSKSIPGRLIMEGCVNDK